MDSLPDNHWINTFQTTPTRPLLTALQRRLQVSTTHVNALAELFHERAAIEHEYATKMSKLIRSAEAGQLNGKGAVKWDRNSAEDRLWEAVLGDIQQTAATHMSLSSALKSDFEQPIRDMPNRVPSWRQIHEQESSLDRTLKEAEKVQAKLDKAGGKRTPKTDALQSELNGFHTTLNSLAPKTYKTFQCLDEDRLRVLKEVVVRWATTRADLATKDGQRAESSLTKLLSWETNDDVIAVGNSLAGVGRAGSVPAPSSTNTTPRRPSTQTTGSTDMGPRMTRTNGSNTVSSASGATGGFSGFKSMLSRKATVSSRQRSGSEVASIRSARRQDDLFAPLSEDGEHDGVAAMQPRPATPQRLNSDRPPQLPRPTIGKSPLVDEEGYSIAPADRHRNPWDEPNEDVPSTTSTGVALPSAILAEQQSLSETSRPSSAAGSFDVPPSRLNLALASTPIKESDEERSAALAKMQQTLQATPGAPVRRTTVARGRREARHTMQVESVATMPQLNALANAGKKDEEELSDEVPLAKLAARADAARRLSVSSVGSRNPFDSPLTQQLTGNAGATTAGATAVGAAVGATAVGVASHASRTGESQTTSVKAPAYHVNPPGLRASVVETISAVISQFASKRTTITGEIQLSFLPTELRPTPAAGSALHIRLTAFDALESIQPNGEFLAQVPDMPGEYYLNMDRLAKGSRAAAAAGTGIVLFTYKVLVPDGSETLMLPLALNPAFQLKDGETRMILHYRATSEVPLGQIALSATFDAEPPVTGTQSKPVGSTWSTTTDGKNNCIVLWQPPTPITTNDAKIVARFITSAGSPKLSPLSVDAHFAINHHLISGVNLEVVDSDVPTALSGWKFDSVDRSTVTGQYSGEPIFNP